MVIKAKAFSAYQTSSKLMGSKLINNAAQDGHTSTSAEMFVAPFDRVVITGAGLEYDSNGFLTDGTITKVEIFDSFSGSRMMVISGLSFDVGDVSPTATTASLEAHPVWKYDGSAVAEIGLGLGAEFRGEGGKDTLGGGQFDDRFFGEGGNDKLQGLAGRDSLQGGEGKDLLEGGDDGDFFVGGKGDDTINGGSGTDMVLSALLPDHAINSDQAIDLTKGTHAGNKIGVDTLISIESFFSGAGDDTITGSSGANTLLGNAGDDVINGKSGSDEIWMGAGHDTVTGGRGADLFVFDSFAATDSDAVKDFKLGTDHIGLVNGTIHFGFFPGEAIAETKFHLGSEAADEDDLVIYNQAKGRLFVDADGNGEGAKVLIATISGKPVLSAADIVVVDFSGDWWLV